MSEISFVQKILQSEYNNIQSQLTEDIPVSNTDFSSLLSSSNTNNSISSVAGSSSSDNTTNTNQITTNSNNIIGSIPPSNSTKYIDIVDEMSQKYNVPANLINKVIEAESNFNPQAVSKTGAQGLMQLEPGTAKSLGVENSFDPAQNIEGGVKYLKQLADEFGNWRLAVAAYNAGPGAVQRYGGIPPYPETLNYVKKILG